MRSFRCGSSLCAFDKFLENNSLQIVDGWIKVNNWRPVNRVNEQRFIQMKRRTLIESNYFFCARGDSPIIRCHLSVSGFLWTKYSEIKRGKKGGEPLSAHWRDRQKGACDLRDIPQSEQINIFVYLGDTKTAERQCCLWNISFFFK